MSYKSLQKEAKKLGLKYVGVSSKKLKADIENAKLNVSDDLQPSIEPEVQVVNKEINAAIVRNDGKEVRTYTKDIHGKQFATLAEEFAKARNYDVELTELKPGIMCPACGHSFYL